MLRGGKMLHLARSMKDLSFSELMSVYIEGNRENGAELAPDDSAERQIAVSEQEFYHYLNDVFFQTDHALYAVWEEKGIYISALRLEPFCDGLLLEALETVPEYRRRGYASSLIRAVQRELSKNGDVRIYSHVNKKNTASLQTHVQNGFIIISEFAHYIDGSVNNRAYTMLYEKRFFEKSKNRD